MALSPKQIALHWRTWAAVCREQGWKSGNDEKRHAAYLVALGQDKSLTDFNNRDLDRVLAQFRVLMNPDNVTAQVAVASYRAGEDQGERKRLLFRIEQLAPQAYTAAICRDRFDTADLGNLGIKELTQLRDTLVNRKVTNNRKGNPDDNTPF